MTSTRVFYIYMIDPRFRIVCQAQRAQFHKCAIRLEFHSLSFSPLYFPSNIGQLQHFRFSLSWMLVPY